MFLTALNVKLCSIPGYCETQDDIDVELLWFFQWTSLGEV